MQLITDITIDNLKKYLINQLNNFFPDGNEVVDDETFSDSFLTALKRLEYCFSHINVNGYYVVDENGTRRPYFQHTNSDQYCQFLYFFSNSLWEKHPEKSDVCDKIILLNKALHACWYTYKVKLPDIFILVHPVGSVIGHANYSDYLVIYHNVTIGERIKNVKTIGKYCFMAAGSSIIGDGEIGDNVSFGINSFVIKEDVPANSIVYIDKNTGERKIEKQKKASKAHGFFIE